MLVLLEKHRQPSDPRTLLDSSLRETKVFLNGEVNAAEVRTISGMRNVVGNYKQGNRPAY